MGITLKRITTDVWDKGLDGHGFLWLLSCRHCASFQSGW